MEEEYKTYQPKWEEKVERDRDKWEHRHHHHHSDSDSDSESSHHHHHSSSTGFRTPSRNSGRYSNGLGGSLKHRDRQAFIGFRVIMFTAVAAGLFYLARFVRHELGEMPKGGDDATELQIDALGVKKGEEYVQILSSDSIAEELQIDSTERKSVLVAKPSVYRPPRKKDNTTIDDREWKEIRKIWSIWYDENGLDWKTIVAFILIGGGLLAGLLYSFYRILLRHGVITKY